MNTITRALPLIILLSISFIGVILILTKDIRTNIKVKKIKKQLEKEKGDKYE